MTCEEYQTLIEEYFDRELDQHTAGLVSIHIERCPSCTTELEQLALETRAYQSYERGVDASPALWNKVHKRIVEAERVQLTSPGERWQLDFSNLLAVRLSVPVSAVLVLSAVLGTIAVMRYVGRKQAPIEIAAVSEARTEGKSTAGATDDVDQPKGNEDGGRSSRGPEAGPRTTTAGRPSRLNPNPVVARTPSQLVRDAEKNYLSAIAILSRDVEQHPSELDAETRAKLDGALASIDRTISATRKAVRKDPSDPLVVQYMLTAYAKKIDVLKEMTRY
jgi:hypothetical protein